MPFAVRIESPLALFRKLERESYRAYHAKTPLHKADHFFNLCVTASSMRDYVLEHLGRITKAQQQPYYQAWSKVPALVAAAEIANSSKHFVLRDPSTGHPKSVKTRTVRLKKASFVSVYSNAKGELKAIAAAHTEVTITLPDGQVLELHEFTEELLDHWKGVLSSLGFTVRRQPFAQLVGA